MLVSIMEWIRISNLLFTLVCVASALSNVEVAKAKYEEEISLRQIYTDLDKLVKNASREILKIVTRVVAERIHEFSVSTKCRAEAFKLFSGLRDLKFWAINFIDASAKLNDGIVSGNVYMYGNYDQCLNASVPKKNGAVDFRGQYCLLSVAAHVPKPELTPDRNERAALVQKLTHNLTGINGFIMQISENFRPEQARFGLCVPSGCTSSDVNNLIKYVGKQVWLNFTLNFCETEDSLVYFTHTRIIILCIYLFVILLVIISSVIDLYSTARKIKFKSPVMRGLICFSLPQNFQKFTSTKVTEENLCFLNGIRVLTLFYVILGHHYLIKMGTRMHRNYFPMMVSTWSTRFFAQIVINGLFTVDVFFFIGGFLNYYLRAKKNFTHFSFSSSFMMIIHRLMRIYPVYIFTILLNLLFNPRGPMAHDLDVKYWEPCRTQWWRNLLFINNIYDVDDQCLPNSWYLAADMHFFLVSLLTIPLLFRTPKSGVLVHLTIILISIAFTTFQVWRDKILPTYVLTNTTAMDIVHVTNEQLLTYPHASGYFGGVLLGFFVTKKKSIQLSKVKLGFGWIVASTTFLTMLFITKRWNSGTPFTRLESALYFSLSRPLYSWSVGWLIYCCFKGHGGFINYILSWKVWIPLSRLCLSAYLISVILQIYYFANLRAIQDFQQEVEIWSFFGDLCITFLLAVPMVFLFESPFIALEKVIFHKKESDSKIKENELSGREIINHENGTNCNIDKSSIKI